MPTVDPARLARFNGLYHGRRAFAIGNGPSLARMDLSPLRQEITFAANRFYLLAKQLGWLPTYLCVSDPQVHEQIAEDLRPLPCVKFIPHLYGRSGAVYCPEPPDAWTYPLRYVWGEGRWLSKQNFCRDICGTFHSGNTVMIDFIIQLAFCMGIRELYLIGCDCTVRTGRHFYDPTAEDRPIDRHEIVMRSYRVCREVFEEDGRKIYNATVGGELEVFERVAFEQVVGRRRAPSSMAGIGTRSTAQDAF